MSVPKVPNQEIAEAMNRKALKESAKYVLGQEPKPTASPITVTETKKHIYVTHSGHKLTYKEARFIDAYMLTGDRIKAVEEAGYKPKDKSDCARKIIKKDYIADEISYRNELYKNAQVADRHEILAFYTAVMRGEVKDQFDLDASLRDRLDAGEKLAKRIIDVEEKKNVQAQQVVVNIDFNRDNNSEETVIDLQQLSD